MDVTIAAFSEGLPGVLGAAGPVLLMVCLIFFAFTTILGWNFYGERCLEYVVGAGRRRSMPIASPISSPCSSGRT